MTLINPENGEEVSIGVELEYPAKKEGQEKFLGIGEAVDFSTRYPGREINHHLGGEITHERIGGSVHGMEIRTGNGGLPFDDIKSWYRSVLHEIEQETGRTMEPVGVMGETTAGLHIHISPLSEVQAERLFEFSKQPWMWVFASTTVANNNAYKADTCAPVLRSRMEDNLYTDYCQLEFNNRHSSVVNSRRDGRYEWRLPEPMTTEHFELLMDFIKKFILNAGDAQRWVRELVRNGDRRLTAVRRAKKVGIDELMANPQTEATRHLLSGILDTRVEHVARA